MPLYLFYATVQKSQKWPKTQIKGGGGGPALRHHYRARNWTFDENHFVVSSSSSFWNASSGENRVKKFSGEVGIKCHQSCLVALAFCTKLLIKLAISLCSFWQFSFPFNF